MKRPVALIAALGCATLIAASPASSNPPADADPLFETISALDTAVFDAFNHCAVGAA